MVIAVLATGGFSFSLWGIAIRSNSPNEPLLILAGAAALRAALSLHPKNLAVLVISLAVTLLGAEGVLRWWYPKEAWPVLRLYYRPAPDIGYEHIPGVAGTDSFGNAIVINSHGLRDVERPWKKPSGVRRVIALGDSFTFGMKVEASSSYPKALEAVLNEKAGKRRYDVINAGVTAYSLCQERKWLDSKGWRYGPDFIVVGFFGDDPFCKGEESGNRFAQIKTYRTFTRTSVLYSFLRNSYSILNARYFEKIRPSWSGGIESRAQFIKENGFTDIKEEDWAGVAEDLKHIRSAARERGAGFLVLVIPDAGQIGFPELQSPTRRLLDICKKEGIDCIDTTPLIEKTEDPLGLYLYPLDPHLNPAGHKLMARVIAEWIAGKERQ